MHPSHHKPDRSVLAGVVRRWRDWLGNRAGRAEFADRGTQEPEAVARHVGAGGAELRALAGKWPDSADLLTRRMAVLGLDASKVAQSQPEASHVLTEHGSLGSDKRQSEHDLNSGTLDPAWRRYCPDSQPLSTLRPERDCNPRPSRSR